MTKHYRTLGVSPQATEAEIKAAFRALAKSTHPDRHPNDPAAAAKFAVVQEAYDVVGDKTRRAAYDREQAASRRAAPAKAAKKKADYKNIVDFCEAAVEVCTNTCAKWSARSFGHTLEAAFIMNVEHFSTGMIPLWASLGLPAAGMAFSLSCFVFGHSVLSMRNDAKLQDLVVAPILQGFARHQKNNFTAESFARESRAAGKRLLPVPMLARSMKRYLRSAFTSSRNG